MKGYFFTYEFSTRFFSGHGYFHCSAENLTEALDKLLSKERVEKLGDQKIIFIYSEQIH